MMKYLLFIIVIAIPLLGRAQSKTISGKVTSAEDGTPLPGVNVLVKGTTNGAVTDIEGKYSIVVSDVAGTLVFSFIGLKSEEVPIGNLSSYDIKMTSDMRQLSEIVVTGYGERERNAFTGAYAAVGKESIENRPVATLDQALQGNVPGLQLSAVSGTPGSIQNIRIRGISSITASNEPLFVVDGVPIVSGTNDQSTSTADLSVISAISPNDIESISVLKDATAAALYGSRGSNGVIIITTKRGKSGKPVVSLSAQSGFVSRAVDGPKMLNAAQWDELYYESRVNRGDAATIEEAKSRFPNGWDGTTDTDWKDVVDNDDAMTQNYDIAISGGTDKSKYYGSVGYFKQDGTNVASDFKRYSGKLGFDNHLSNKVLLRTSFIGSFVKQNGQLEGSAYYGNPDAAYLFLHPTDKAYNDDGTPNLELSNSTFNPIYIAEHSVQLKTQSKIFNTTTIEYNILDHLKFTSQLGIDYMVTEELYYDDPHYGDAQDLKGSSYVYNNRNFNWVWKNMIDYGWDVSEDHRLDFKLVHEAQKNQHYGVAAGGYGFATDGLIYPISAGTPDEASAFTRDWSIHSLLGIINYSFRKNIFFDASLRGDGNSKFAPSHRWGAFYSLGASWVLSNEAFMQDLTNWLTSAKLRVTYGKTGNAGDNGFINKYQSLLSYSGQYNGDAAAYPTQYGNTLLSWESSKAWNFGVDLTLFDKVNASVDYFRRESYDLLLDVPLSYTTGFSSQTQNLGNLVNKGIEVMLNSNVVQQGTFVWNIGINLTSVHNEVTDLPKNTSGTEIGITSGTQKVTVGKEVYSWYMPTWAGVDPQTGSPLWYIEGTSGETTATYAQAGKSFHGSAAPTFYGGLTNRFDFKGIYLSANLYYSTGNNVYDSWAAYTMSDGRFTYNTATGYASQYDRWKQPGDISKNPKNVYGNTSLSANASTRRLYDGEYLRLKDVTLGYNLPSALIAKLKLSSVQLYLKGTNIWTYVKDDNLEFDPEVRADGFLAIQAPPLKSYLLGVKVSF